MEEVSLAKCGNLNIIALFKNTTLSGLNRPIDTAENKCN